MSKVSVVINVVDEEVEILPRALNSVKKLADEVVIIDQTIVGVSEESLKGYPCEVYKTKRVEYVELVRNFGISKATGDWVLILDPDEELEEPLLNRLKSIVENSSADYYRIPRKNIIFARWIKHSRWWPDYNIRFFRKGFVSWNEQIHTVPITKGKGADLPDREEFAIVHHHYDTLGQYIERMNRYTDALSKRLINEGYKFSWKDLVTRPVNEFLSRYFQGEGYKDGIHGLALSGLQAFGESIVYLKVWQSEKFPAKEISLKDISALLKEKESDLHFWQADSLYKENGGLKNRLKRKFKLP